MPIGEILEKSFKYPWKNKALWFYGFWIAFFAGSGGSNYQFNEKDVQSISNNINLGTLMIVGVVVIVLVLALSILGLIVSSWSHIALMKGVRDIEAGKKIERKEIGKTGKKPVWKFIVLNFFIPIGIVLALLIPITLLIALFAIMPQPTGLYLGIIAAIILILIFIPVLIYLGLVWSLAGRYVGLEDKNAIEAIKMGRAALKGKFWWSFALSLILGLISGAIGGILSLPIVFLALGIIASIATGMTPVAIVLGIITLILYIPYLIALGYLTAFSQTGWTLWWMELKKLKTESVKLKPTA